MKIQRRAARGAAAALAILAYGGAGPKAALAADGAVLTAPANRADAALRAYWTPERLASAQPLDVVTANTFESGDAVAPPMGPTDVVPGAPPSAPYDDSLAEQLYLPSGRDELRTAAVGSIGQRYPYTIDRLYPCRGSGCPTSSNSYSNVWAFYPYQIVGKLYFDIGTPKNPQPKLCSASVIRRSVIGTAGHCVSDGKGHFYSKWLFVPAEHGGLAPFGKWDWTQVVVTGPWLHGGGTFPNKQDDALIVLAANSSRQKIGNITGYLGYEYNAPLPTHLTQLGYPCNLDGCIDPIRDDSQVYSGPSNNFEWGTAAFFGASGGPEIQDFGQQPSHDPGTPPFEAFGGNVLISSTSYTYPNYNAVQVDGGSILAAPGQFGGTLNTFGDLIKFVCATPGNC